MGKKQKIRTGAGDLVSNPGPLHKQIEKTKLPKQKFKLPKAKEIKDVKFVDPSLSSKILLEAKKQLEEEKEIEDEDEEESSDQDEEDEENDSILNEKELEIINEHEKQTMELGNEIDHQQNEIIHKKKKEDTEGISLHDLIRQKAAEQRERDTKHSNLKDIEYKDLDPAVVKLYTEIGQVMEKYRSGKVPKAFKVIPSLLNWEQIIELTFPEKWTAAAMLQATKMFSATATPNQCQKFYNLVLLPRVRDDIDEFKKLHFHVYQCLFKAMYKPAAFFKGILLPLCRSGTCTLREAVIFGSVLRKISIPQMHAAAAMLSVAEMDYNASNSHILMVFIQKNYTLPFRVLDGLVFHFLRMRSRENNQLPVSWHQCLLSFVELYAKDISSEQREALIELTKAQSHHQITPEIQRILRSSESRNEESEANMPDYAKDGKMEF